MVFITIVTGAYKPTYFLGASHCRIVLDWFFWGPNFEDPRKYQPDWVCQRTRSCNSHLVFCGLECQCCIANDCRASRDRKQLDCKPALLILVTNSSFDFNRFFAPGLALASYLRSLSRCNRSPRKGCLHCLVALHPQRWLNHQLRSICINCV